MKNRRSNSILMIIALTAVLLVPAHSDGFQRKSVRKPGNGLVTWFVELYDRNHNYIEVSIDALKVHPESTVQEAFFDVDFHYPNGTVKTQRFWFTSDNLQELSAGYIHLTWRAHPFGLASYATGACLYYAIGIEGLRQANPTRFLLKDVNPKLKGSADHVKEYPAKERDN